MKQSIIVSLLGCMLTTPLFLNVVNAEPIGLKDISVKSDGFERKESETTYASEIHTEKQIEASGAATLYDYLAQQSSLNIAPNFGNKATPSINLRGYGGENGYQNIAITVDGQRLNNIDMTPQLLAGISLGNIERIEISKGSGSVLYGDGATAGAIQIYTKAKTGVTILSSLGNIGQKNHYASAGIVEEKIELSASLAHDSHDGFSRQDATGHKDQFTSNSQNAKLKIKPTDKLQFTAQGASSRNDIRYVNSLTRAEFKANPRLSKGTSTHQALNSDQWQVDTQYKFSDALQVAATHYREDKLSEFINFNSAFNYDYESDEVKLSYADGQSTLLFGLQSTDAERIASDNRTAKNAQAWHISGSIVPFTQLSDLTLSAGVRKEEVKYRYRLNIGNSLRETEKLSAWDIGANYRISEAWSVFANTNKSYQAPDIDRFFNFGGTFNGFILPMDVRTFNLGTHIQFAQHRFKATAFHANLNNEIYFNPVVAPFGINTNLDQSKKYGLELQDVWQITDNLTASAIYNYTRAVVEREDLSSGLVIRNKTLPGTPKHSVVANLNWQFYPNASVNVNHTWRARAYAYNDFDNNNAQQQRPYLSTNLALNYAIADYTLFASINNLFEQENQVLISDDAIYPLDFVRTWRIGMRANF